MSKYRKWKKIYFSLKYIFLTLTGADKRVRVKRRNGSHRSSGGIAAHPVGAENVELDQKIFDFIFLPAQFLSAAIFRVIFLALFWLRQNHGFVQYVHGSFSFYCIKVL